MAYAIRVFFWSEKFGLSWQIIEVASIRMNEGK